MACLFPFYVNDVPVPCGRCPKCLVRRADSWIFRILQEERTALSSYFLTLTYDDDHVPITDNKFMTLVKRDFQLFMKRLRRAHPRGHRPLKYYACGEYGSRFQRPHYHVVILNADPRYFNEAWCDDEGVMIGDVFYQDRPLTSNEVGYTTGYMNKPKIVPCHRRDDRLREFSCMSKRLGLSYLTPEIVNYHRSDVSRNFVTLPGGTKSALPRYYADRIYTDEDKEARAPYMDSTIRRQHKATYDEHIRLYGSADDFIRAQAEARRSAVVNFQVKSKNRKG